jgi:Restriction endonuclease
MTTASPQTLDSLNNALRIFEATEANLDKLDRLWGSIREKIPSGVVYGDDPDCEDWTRSFNEIAESLPAIDGWRLESSPMTSDEIASIRIDAMEVGEFECQVSTEKQIYALDSELREYRFRLNRKRRHIVRALLGKKIETVDALLISLQRLLNESEKSDEVKDPQFIKLRQEISEINTLMGSSVKRPTRWTDLTRHLGFGLFHDLSDIITHDWPTVKPALLSSLIGENEPIPTGVPDLDELVVSPATSAVVTALNWGAIDADGFERLVFNLISATEGYENPQWLMQTNAPDKGRDLSVTRITVDKLAGTSRSRVIIQCKHWLTKSISLDEISKLMTQLTLWEPPLVDACIIATSGRFSADAVAFIEKNNQTSRGIKIEMWPESHFEILLASRPGLIAEFGLR